jgi:hypothetical protein
VSSPPVAWSLLAVPRPLVRGCDEMIPEPVERVDDQFPSLDQGLLASGTRRPTDEHLERVHEEALYLLP